MAKSIGVGVIGIGMGGTMFPLNREESSPFEVRSICSSTPSKLEEAAKEWDISHWTTDYLEVIKRPDVDVIGVYSPDHLHAEHVTAALEAGKHIVCTKPMVTSVEDADRLVKLVDEKGVKFVSTNVEAHPRIRLTATFELLAEIKNVYLLVTGNNKKDIVEEIVKGETNLPVNHLINIRTETHLLTDQL